MTILGLVSFYGNSGTITGSKSEGRLALRPFNASCPGKICECVKAIEYQEAESALGC